MSSKPRNNSSIANTMKKKKPRAIEKAIGDCHQVLEAGGSPFVLIGCLQMDGFSLDRAKHIVRWAKNLMPKIMEPRLQSDPAQW